MLVSWAARLAVGKKHTLTCALVKPVPWNDDRKGGRQVPGPAACVRGENATLFASERRCSVPLEGGDALDLGAQHGAAGWISR